MSDLCHNCEALLDLKRSEQAKIMDEVAITIGFTNRQRYLLLMLAHQPVNVRTIGGIRGEAFPLADPDDYIEGFYDPETDTFDESFFEQALKGEPERPV
jgi:hypothetical protein